MRTSYEIFFFLLFVLNAVPGMAEDEPTPEALMRQVWEHYNHKGCEIEQSMITTTSWGDEPRYGTRWVANGNNMLFVLNRNEELREKPDGLLLEAGGPLLGYRVYIQKRGSIKGKGNNFMANVLGTAFSYFDLARTMGEPPEMLECAEWERGVHSSLTFGTPVRSVKVELRGAPEDDYAFRVFHIAHPDWSDSTIPTIVGVEYYREGGQLDKIQENEHLVLHDDNLWRPELIRITQFRNSGDPEVTTIMVLHRSFKPPDAFTLTQESLTGGGLGLPCWRDEK